jgi:hypothetical protein
VCVEKPTSIFFGASARPDAKRVGEPDIVLAEVMAY